MKIQTMNARNYSPAVYLAALKHSAGTAAARGAETRRETARNAAIVKLTVAAVLQAAEDVTARRAPSPSAEAIPETVAVSPAETVSAARPRFNLAEMVRRASAEYRPFVEQYPAARGSATWRAALRNAAEDMRAEAIAGTAAEFWRRSGDEQYSALRRAASRVPVWSARAHYGADAETASAVLPAARWTLYSSGDRAPSASAADERETVFRSMGQYAWFTPRAMGGNPTETWNDALDMIAAETWTRLAARRDAGKDGDGTPYYLTIYRETMQAAAAIGRKSHDRPARQKDYTPSLDALRDASGDGADAGMFAASRFPSPEAETCLRDALRTACLDDLDRTIIRAAEYGYDQPEIARAADVDQSTVSRRLRRIASRLRAMSADADGAEAETVPAVPVPSVREVPGDAGTASPASRLYVHSVPAPETVPATVSPEAETVPAETVPDADADALRAAYRDADERATRSLERLAARREAETAARAASASARPRRYVPPADEREARLRAVYAASAARAARRGR